MAQTDSVSGSERRPSAWSPLRLPVFRALWLATLATWYLGPFIFRAAALGCFGFAGVLLLLSGTDGSVNPGGAAALFCAGAALWTLGHALYRLRYGFWATRLAVWLLAGRLSPRRRSGGQAARRPVSVEHGRARPR